MDHTLRSSCLKRHVQRVQHQLADKCRRHRPTNDAAAVGIEHHREIQKASPGRYICDVRHPQPVRFFGREVAIDQVRRLTAITSHRGSDEPAPAHTRNTGLSHQPGDALTANTNAVGHKLGMDARRAISATRSRVRRADIRRQCSIRLGPT